jgi:hypothetical protein
MNQPLPLPTHFLSSAIAAVIGPMAEVEQSRIKLRALEVQLAHNQEMYAIKADFMRDLVHSLIDRRVDAVERGFRETISLYAEQSRHYMAQQDKYADAEINATSPAKVASIKERRNEIDNALRAIRSDAAALYHEMTRAILIIGGSMPAIPTEDQRALALTI